MLDVTTVPATLFGVSPLQIQERHDEAFDVEAVTFVTGYYTLDLLHDLTFSGHQKTTCHPCEFVNAL